MARKPRKPSAASVKAAAERAARRSAGEEVEPETASPVMDPPDVRAEKKSVEKPRTKRAIGRPSKYSPALARALCKMLERGMTLTSVCRRPDMPHYSTIMEWLQKDKEFSERYTRARRLGYERWADEIVDVADDGRNDWEEIETRGGSYIKLNREATERSRLRVDTRKWLLAKALPKIYGDKLDVKHEAGEGFAALWKMCSAGVPVPAGEPQP